MEDHPEQRDGTCGARIVLGMLACILLLCAVEGIHLIVQSFEEETRLAGSGASGSEYLGVGVGRFLALILLIPAILAIRPVRASLVAAQMTTGLWWVVWTLAFATSAGGGSIDVVASRIAAVLVLALPPALFTACIHRIGRGLEGA